MSEADCLFCRMGRGEVPVDKLHEDDLVFALADIAPRAPVHLLVIPKQHLANAREVGEAHAALLGRMFAVAARLAVEKGISDAGYRLAVNVGEAGGQTIFHLHMHVLGGRQLGPEG